VFPKADDIVQHVSAASVIAKETRDHQMGHTAHRQYPVYDFNENMGYGTKAHRQALKEHGPCPLHRRTFLRNSKLSEESV
jgi:ribonuclease HII